MRPDRWLQHILRLPARPLQIPEIVEMAEEHLQAAAMEGLRQRYLPSRLVVAVSVDDYRGLAPFTAELGNEMQRVLERVAEIPRYNALAQRLDVHLIEAGDLKPGSPPRFYAKFPDGDRRAAWDPEAPAFHLPSPEPMPVTLSTGVTVSTGASQPLAVPGPGLGDGLFEIVQTAAAVESTGFQSVYVLCLDPALPMRCLDPEAADGRLVFGADGTLRDEAGGEPWRGLAPQIHELQTAVPVELDGSVDMPPEARRSKLCRFYVPGRVEVLWAPQGLLLVGRRPELVHWVPATAPRNLSGRHFALLRGTAQTLRVVDLGSTNGTYLAGRRLQPFERVQVSPPETLEVGTEKTMRLDLRFPTLAS